jgi:histone H3/H4
MNDGRMSDQVWRHCSICKTPIGFQTKHFLCSVSTCNRKRTGLFFCTVACWDAHLPMMRHRDAWAEEGISPSREQWQRELAEERERGEAQDGDAEAESAAEAPAPRRRIVSGGEEEELPKEVLVVVSKVKAYVRARSGMNTSDSVVGVLSDHVRRLCDLAIRNAARDGRKTVMDRDFEPRS